MEILIILVILILLMFAFVLLFGAPFLPTLNHQMVAAFQMLELKKGQTLLDLGSGDGRVLKMAARKGIKARGYELNPVLVIVSMLRCLKDRRNVTIRCQNFWRADIGDADAIFVFLLKRFMPKLDKKITQEISKPVKVVSFAFAFPGREPVKQSAGLMLYEFKPKK